MAIKIEFVIRFLIVRNENCGCFDLFTEKANILIEQIDNTLYTINCLNKFKILVENT